MAAFDNQTLEQQLNGMIKIMAGFTHPGLMPEPPKLPVKRAPRTIALTADMEQGFNDFAREIGRVNPTAPQVKAARELIAEHGLKKIQEAIQVARIALASGDKYAPVIANFTQLQDKWISLKSWVHRKQTKSQSKVAII